MSSNAPSVTSKVASITAKSSNNSSQISPATSSQTQAFFSNDSGQRRSGSGGVSGTGASKPSPRNTQSAKAQHKASKRYNTLGADEMDVHLKSRKGQQDITHLMQFQLPPRPQQSMPHRSGLAKNSRRTWGMGSGYHSVDKARYVHANYRFIVDPRADYRAQSTDADLHLDWDNILQIIASEQSQSSSCPICLGTPTAPRMARCGHIFCLPCLIRYMHSEDGGNPQPEKRARSKKCPICWDSIYISETRPVRWYDGQEGEAPREGDDVVLRLVKRPAGSTLAMPRDSADSLLHDEAIPWFFAADVMDYARVMKGSEEYMIEQFEASIRDVEMLEREDELMFGEDSEWTSRATRTLREAKERVKGIGNPPTQPVKPEETRSKRQVVPERWEDDEGTEHHEAVESSREVLDANEVAESASYSNDSTPTQNTNNHASPASPYIPRTLHEMRQRQHERPQPSEYLFYQGLLHYYLSPLDIRILKAGFGPYTSFPSSILPRVERVSAGHIVDDELRKRVKYLAHLPYGCEVAFLECDWTDTVSPQILATFKGEIEHRRRRNEEKETREEKERVRVEKMEMKEFADARRKRPSSIRMDDEAFAPLVPPSHLDPASTAAASTTPGSTQGSSPPWPNHRATSGFASLASPSTSPSTLRSTTVWGTAAINPHDPDSYSQLPRDDELHDDGWLQGWEKDLLGLEREEELVGRVQAASLEDPEGGVVLPARGSGANGGGGGKKGKKGKKITLMSTTARRLA